MLGSSRDTPPGGRGSVSGGPGGGLQSVDMLYSNGTNIGPLPIVKAHQSQHNKSTPNKSPLSKSPAYRGHLGVFHKLCKVEECRCDLRDVGDKESQLQIAHQVLLLSCPQLHPAGDIDTLNSSLQVRRQITYVIS